MAWAPLGWQAAAVAEVEPFACEVLRQRWPRVPNLGDVTRITAQQVAALGPLDVVCFGSPCQDLSLAGRRKGLIDADGAVTRSGLFFDAMRIFGWARQHCGARWALWENVPGAYSSNQGRDFAAVVAAMAGLRDLAVPRNGWGTEGAALGDAGLLEWACMDAQWFGVAQRRRRVFALLDAGDWASRGPVLLERHSLRGDFAPRQAEGAHAAASAGGSAGNGGGHGVAQGKRPGDAGTVRGCYGGGASREIDVSTTLLAKGQRQDFESETLVAEVAPTIPARAQGGGGLGTDFDCGGGLVAEADQPYTLAIRGRGDGSRLEWRQDGTANALLTSRGGRAGMGIGAVCKAYRVRRLTPVECERLQGFDDGYTQIAWRGKPPGACPDGPRYTALGNSWAVPVVRWIGARIAAAHAASGGRAA